MAGTVLGFVAFALLRTPMATIGFTGDRFFPADLALTGAQAATVAVGVPFGAASAALVAFRRVRVTPLGVRRRTTPAPPRAWRVVPLVAGIAELLWFAVLGRPATSSAQVPAYVPGIVLVLVGLVVAGPWLTMAGARLLARRSGRPAVLIASRRLADDPPSGVSIDQRRRPRPVRRQRSGRCHQHPGRGAATVGDDGSTLVQRFTSPEDSRPTSLTVDTLDRLAAVPGVFGVTQAHLGPRPRRRRPGAPARPMR